MLSCIPELIWALDTFFPAEDYAIDKKAMLTIDRITRSNGRKYANAEELFFAYYKNSILQPNMRQLLGFMFEYIGSLSGYPASWILDRDFIFAGCRYGGPANGHDEFVGYTHMMVCRKADLSDYPGINVEKLEFVVGSRISPRTVQLDGSQLRHFTDGERSSIDIHDFISYDRYLLVSPFGVRGAWIFERFEEDERY